MPLLPTDFPDEPKILRAMPVPGICKLCKQQRDLLDSHLLPKAVYKHIRRSDGAGNKIVAVSHEIVTFTDRQIQDHLLCADCEDRFGRMRTGRSQTVFEKTGVFLSEISL